MKTIQIFILALVFINCENVIETSDETDLEKAKEYIIGKWITEKYYPDTSDSTTYIIRKLQFGSEYFEFRIERTTEWRGVVTQTIIKGEYNCDSVEQLSITITDREKAYPYIDWEIGDTMFWEIQSITQSELIICFEPNKEERVYFNFIREEN